ncbi:MAG TPA: hypothetical protein VJT75_10130 [Thermoleophilaceae bacterium]|nr:hypothetical protein [Thermoleophilaceae bacterium]
MTTKITALIAALTVAVASFAMATQASAAKNTHRYQTSGEKKRKDRQDRCQKLHNEYNEASDTATAYGNAYEHTGKQTDLDAARLYDEDAAAAQEKAGHLGCGWALRISKAPEIDPHTAVQISIAPIGL